MNICKRCSKEYKFNKNIGNTVNFCGSCRTTMARQRLKIKAVNHLGGKCSKCGYNEYIGALTFHHLNPSEKTFTFGKAIIGWEKAEQELKKCILLCMNCHAEEHRSVQWYEINKDKTT